MKLRAAVYLVLFAVTLCAAPAVAQNWWEIGFDPSVRKLLNDADPPANGECMTWNATTSAYNWASCTTSSTVVIGPASATDEAICRFDSTTGKLVQNSALKIADTTGNLSGPAGGFKITGGTASGDDLTLESTAHAVKGSVFVGVGGDGVLNVSTIEHDGALDLRDAGSGNTFSVTFATQTFDGDTLSLGSGAAASVGWIGTLAPAGNNANSFLVLPLTASPPASPSEGQLYSDTSHALCWYNGSAWVVVAGAGTCA